MQHLYISTKDVERLKQKARELKRATNISHHVALDEIAKQHGFNHWHHIHNQTNLLSWLKMLFLKGVCWLLMLKMRLK